MKKRIVPSKSSYYRIFEDKQKNNLSGVKGVQKRPSGPYVAQIWFKNKPYYLGTFDTIEEAAAARIAAEEKYFKPILREFNKQAKYKVEIKEDEEE